MFIPVHGRWNTHKQRIVVVFGTVYNLCGNMMGSFAGELKMDNRYGMAWQSRNGFHTEQCFSIIAAIIIIVTASAFAVDGMIVQ